MLAKAQKAWLPAILFLLFACLPIPPLFFSNTDTFWHIRLGQIMLETEEIVSYAAGSYAAAEAPYVAHEVVFQVLAAWIYNALGWKGFLILRLVCVLFLWIGLLAILRQAARERGGRVHPLSYLAAFGVLYLATMLMFTIRPQMLSLVIALWAFALIRSIQEKPTAWKSVLLGLLSMALAGIHGGVWPMLPVLWFMTLLEKRKWTVKHIWATAAIAAGGLLNPGGIRTIFYVLFVSSHPLTREISEWAPVPVQHPIFAGFTLLYLWCVFRYTPKTFYHLTLAGAILILGFTAIRQFVWPVLFLPYFLPVDSAVGPRPMKKWAIAAATAALLINSTIAWNSPLSPDEQALPVREMAYIKAAHTDQPKVLAPYAASGYVFFSGGLILADGRFDPFVHDSTRSESGLTAAERSLQIYRGNVSLLWEEIELNRPDFLIYPKSDEPVKKRAVEQIEARYGEPDFEGPYGYVWKLK